MIQRARDRYGKHFEGHLEYYYRYGVVYSGYDAFFMAVGHDKDFLLGNKNEKDIDKQDCWYVHYHTGDMKRLFEAAPKMYEWVVFESKGHEDPKCYSTERIRRLIYGRKEKI